MEKVSYDDLFDAIKSSIITQPHGFYAKRSIESNLIQCTNYINNMDC